MPQYSIGGIFCAAAHCRNNQYENRNLSFFRFPKDEERHINWAKNSGRTDLINVPADVCYKKYRLCSTHFGPIMFTNSTQKRLLPLAIPTIFGKSTNETIVPDITASTNNVVLTAEKAVLSAADESVNVALDICERADTSKEESILPDVATSNVVLTDEVPTQTPIILSSNTPRKKIKISTTKLK